MGDASILIENFNINLTAYDPIGSGLIIFG